ncbi:MAG TPA: hypothetical protein VKZ85_10425 [Woeseiaceae bacterium]|nr:hypothetical protein [Woeseiaceae bacterium]
MKYLFGFIVGTLFGAALCLAGLYHNPFADARGAAAIAISDQLLGEFSFPAVAAESIAFTNDGESTPAPHPAGIAELWEPAISRTRVLVTVMTERGEPAGIGVKFSSDSEATRLLRSEALVDSAWHVYLPGRGTFFVDQTENLWGYLRDVVIPARWSSADSWRGTWFGIVTAGPNALRTARLVGGSGRFADLDAEAVETWNARAYSTQQGPVAMQGSLMIALPGPPPVGLSQ